MLCYISKQKILRKTQENLFYYLLLFPIMRNSDEAEDQQRGETSGKMAIINNYW